jgi:hypothetical protein
MRWGVLAFVFLLSSGFAHLHAQACMPSFPLRDNWQGADAAYSIPLADGRSVWIFGDTLNGDRRVVEANQPRMVRNSIGISRCDGDGKWQLQYVIRHGRENQPPDFFQAQNKGTWYWALDGFTDKNDLWVTLLCVRNARVKRPDGFDFETCGTDLAKVSDLGSDPQKWKVSYFSLVPDGAGAYPSATTVVDDGYVYLFALYEEGARPMLVTRIPLSGLDSPARNLQYLSKRGEWKSGFKPENAMPVMDHGATEMTIRYHPEMKKWLAVMKSPEPSSDAILLRTAPKVTGPWSGEQVIYHIPEMLKTSPSYDKNIFCYAGKEHPEFESQKEKSALLITYVCNTMKVPDLVTNLDIYEPKVVVLPPPAEKAASDRSSGKNSKH